MGSQQQGDNLGNAARAALRSRNLTVNAASHRLRIDRNTLAKLTNGVPLSLEVAERFARGLDLDVNRWRVLNGYDPVEPKNPLLAGIDAIVARYGPENARATSAKGVLDHLSAPPDIVPALLAEMEAEVIQAMRDAGKPLPEGPPLFIPGE